jgi:HK97 family phage portal protein
VTSLRTSGGRLLRVTGPRNGIASSLYGFGGGLDFDGIWTDRSEAEGTERRLISYSEIYDTQPVVAAAVNRLAQQGATLPLKVYERQENGERDRVVGHPLDELLSKPVARRGSVHLKQWALLPMLIHGNALLAKYRKDPDGPPTALLPVSWSKVEAYAPEGGPVEWWATTQTGERRWIDVADTIHFAWESPQGEIGTSPLRQLGTTIQVEDAAQRYQQAMFKNGARPTGAIKLAEGTPLDPETRAEMRRDIERLHAGIGNAGRPVLLPGGASWEAMAHSAHEAELIEQRKLNREEIAMVYNLPGPLIGDLEHGTYTNVTELNKQLYKSVLRPWLTLIEEIVQAHLIDPEPEWDGLFCEFDLGEQLKGDPVELANALRTQVEAGVMTRNEARKFLNLPRDPNPQADQLFFAANNQASLADASLADARPDGPAAPPQLP